MAMAGLDAAYVEIDIFTGAQHQPWYLELNELGEIPTLRDGSRVVGQSPLILKHLASRAGILNDVDPEKVDFWLAFEQNRILPSAALKRFLIRFVGGTSPDVLTFLDGRIDMALGKMERVLETRAFLAGDTVSIADIGCSAYLMLLDEAEYDTSRWPAFCAWLDRFRRVPGYRDPYSLLPKGDGRLEFSTSA